MAHQAHILPWQMLADNFKFVYANKKYQSRTNLYPCFKRGQGNQLQHFARVFARLMDDFSAQERKKYSDKLVPPEDDEIFIPDATVKRIAKTVGYYKTPISPSPYHKPPLHLSDEERKLEFWLTSIPESTRMYPKNYVRECMELLKTLILRGEMEPLLRLASHPGVDLQPLYDFPWDYISEYGWSDIKSCALMAYLCLNMFLVKPELYDPVCKSRKLDEMRKKYGLAYTDAMFDYRNTSSYQKMLMHCTWTRWNNHYEVCSLPHREFFGIERNMITTPSWSRLARDRVGMSTLSDILDARYRSWHVPAAGDVSAVLSLLKTKVPTEIALQILEEADYSVKRRVPVPKDPLHADNAEELKKYVSYCWKLLVRVDMLWKANGRWVDWEYEVTEKIFELWGVPYPKMSTIINDEEYEGRQEGEIEQRCRLRREFI